MLPNKSRKGIHIFSLFVLIILIVLSIHPLYAQCELLVDGDLNGAVRVATAYIDNDSLLDIVATGVRADLLVWYKAPDWQRTTISLNLDTVMYFVAVDMDSDEDTDVVASVFGDDAIFWFENPDWTRHTIVDTLDGASGIAVIDVDGDDTLDVVAAGGWANIIVWYEAPNWIPHIIDNRADSTAQGGAETLVAADLDLDGNLEIVASVWHSLSSFTEGSIVRYEGPDWTKYTVDNSIGWCPDLAIGDLNNDDTLDVAASGFGNNVVVWYDVTGWQRHTIDPYLNNAYGVVIDDLDGDGINDIVAAGHHTKEPVRWYRGPDWIVHAIDPSLSGRNYGDVDVGFFDGDTLLDVVATRINLSDVALFVCVTALEDGLNEYIPYSYTLQQNYPNPFNPSTKITFTLPKPENVILDVFNIMGQKVYTLLDKKMNAGTYDVGFDATALASGIYYYRIEAGEFQDVKKMIFIK